MSPEKPISVAHQVFEQHSPAFYQRAIAANPKFVIEIVRSPGVILRVTRRPKKSLIASLSACDTGRDLYFFGYSDWITEGASLITRAPLDIDHDIRLSIGLEAES